MAACLFGFSSGAMAQYEADESDPLILNVSGSGDTQLTSNCTWKPEKGSDNYLPENNEAFYDEGNYLGTLIDGDQATYWHSDPTGMDYHTQLEYIQADLGRDDLQRVYLMFNRRYDPYNGGFRVGVMPTNFNILATNTPDDENSWVSVASISDVPNTSTEAAWPYFSPLIDFGGKAYRYVRVVPTAGNYPYWCPAEMQFYPAREISDYRVALQNVVDSIYDSKLDFVAGTTPGYISQADYDTYNSTFAGILDLIDNPSSTQERLKAAIGELRTLVSDTYAKIIPLPTDNYFIESAYPAFAEQQPGVTYAMVQLEGTDNVRWAKLDEGSAGYYFYVERLADGNYKIRSLRDFRYMGEALGDARVDHSYLKYIDADSVEQILTPTGKGSFYISAQKNPSCYLHALEHANGGGTGGTVEPASQKDDPELWAFVAADTTNLTAIRNLAARTFKAEALADSISGARSTLLQMMAPDNGYITEASQLSTNCMWQADNDVDKLIDGDHNTYFHSTTDMNLFNEDEWLQVDLNSSDISRFVIEYWGRADGGPAHAWHDTPNNIVIKATNTPDDEASWTEVASFTKGFPGNYDDAHYVSPVVDMKAPYRYVRMYVKGTTSGFYYWNLSEFRLYPSPIVASAGSLYSKVAEVKAASDELYAALNTADAHIANLSVDGSELAPVKAALAKLDDVQRNTARIRDIVAEANSLYNTLFVVDTAKTLIKVVNTHNDGTNQLWSNCTWKGIDSNSDNYPTNAAFINDGYNLLGTLIDNNDQTYWHSDPNGFNVNSQVGYFQIDTKRSDVSSFVFMIYRRHDLYNGAYRVGQVPATAEVYATNDETVGTDVNSSMDSWTLIGRINNIPSETTEGVWPYYTPAVGSGTAYRFLRVRMHDSSQGYFGLSGFNVYDAADRYDHVSSQYYSVDGMSAAADKLVSLAAAVQTKLDNNDATLADGQDLQSAIDAVRALYQDRGSLATLVERAKTLSSKAIVGPELGQLSDQAVLDALDAAAAAGEASFSSTADFNAAKQALQDAIENFHASIVGPDASTWYNIVSNSTRAYAVGQPIFLGSTSTGAELKLGRYPIETLDITDDPYAIWRFVPATDVKGAYYIQSLGTGQYFGEYRGQGAGSSPLMRHSKAPYYLWDDGEGGVKLQQCGVGNIDDCLKADGTNFIVLNYPANGDRQQSWRLEPVPADKMVYFNTFADNNALIFTLPWATDGDNAITTLNGEKFQTYAVKNLTVSDEGSRLELTKKQDFQAGEPMILVVGDPDDYNGTAALAPITFALPETVSDTSAVVSNGLVGTLEGLTIGDAGLGIFSGAVLKATTGGEFVSGRSGYIDPRLVTDAEATLDLVITSRDKMLTSIQSARTIHSARTLVNVYTIDGVLVKKGVKASTAAEGLEKGIYIIGKDKVLVK